MSNADHFQSPTASDGGRSRNGAGDRLVQSGRSLRILALIVIVLLSVGLGVVLYSDIQFGGTLASVLAAPKTLGVGFVLLMLLTVGYLVSKQFVIGRNQSQLIEKLLEEESAARALQLNPITQFHHPDVCRDILLLQAGHAARRDAPISILELQIPNLEVLSRSDNNAFGQELIRLLRSIGRPSDSLLRWSPDSFLLVFPEVTEEEMAPVSERLRREVEQWVEERLPRGGRPALRWRGITELNLGSTGDILAETHRLLEQHSRQADHNEGVSQARPEKSIALALDVEIHGVDRRGNPFREKVVTERVAADRIWFEWKQDLAEQTPLTVVIADRNLEESAELARWIVRGEERVAEVRFAHTPERWVLRADG
jgi:GGDEF domain-containing protein